jgi:hypothetical protein
MTRPSGEAAFEVNKEIKLEKILLTFLFYLLLQGTAHARTVLLTWDDNSDNETGFFVERTVSDDCVDGWAVIAYTRTNQNFLMDAHIHGACYRVAAYNEFGASTYSNTTRVPVEPDPESPTMSGAMPATYYYRP